MGGQRRLTEIAWAVAAVLLLVGSLALWGVFALNPTPPPTIALSHPPPANTTPAVDDEQDPAESFSRDVRAAALAATVHVVNATTGADGSGVLVKQSDPFVYVLTADHVAAGGDRFELSTFSIKSYPKAENVYRSATLLAHSPTADLAVLRIETDDRMPQTARLCPPPDLPEGSFPALSVGCDGGRAPIYLGEKILAKRRLHKPGETVTALYWEAARTPVKGRSGGPLFEVHGRVIGMASGVGDNKGYYVHVQEIHAFLTANGLKSLYE